MSIHQCCHEHFCFISSFFDLVYFSWDLLFEPWRHKRYLWTCSDSDKPAHSRSLIRIFPGSILDSQGCKVSSCRQQRLWSDCTDVQADQNLCWVHMSEGMFSYIAGHLMPMAGSYIHLLLYCYFYYLKTKRNVLHLYHIILLSHWSN